MRHGWEKRIEETFFVFTFVQFSCPSCPLLTDTFGIICTATIPLYHIRTPQEFGARPKETICLFHAHLLGVLPEHCNCESVSSWQSFPETKETHNEEYEGSIEDGDPYCNPFIYTAILLANVSEGEQPTDFFANSWDPNWDPN